MRKLEPTSPSVNASTSTPEKPDAPAPDDPSESPSDLLFLARNKVLEARAMASVVADAVCALPAKLVDERMQALMVVCERTIEEALAALEALMKKKP